MISRVLLTAGMFATVAVAFEWLAPNLSARLFAVVADLTSDHDHPGREV